LPTLFFAVWALPSTTFCKAFAECIIGFGGCPFLLVFVEARAVAGAQEATCTYCASVYSSQTSAWSVPAPRITSNYYDFEKRLPSLVIGDALYFTLRCDVSILRSDLDRHRLSIVDTRRGCR
jgi:hypothetical protein